MGRFNCVCAVVRTRNRRGSGTRRWPRLVINQGGTDGVNRLMRSPQSVGSLKRGESFYYYQALPSEGEEGLRDDLIGPRDLYVRLTLTAGSWEPELVFVWAMSRGRGMIPLAVDLDVSGAVGGGDEDAASLPIPRVFLGTDDTPIRRLLLTVVTYDAPYAGTDDPIWLRISDAERRVVDGVITDTPQTDLEIDTPNVYEIAPLEPFTRRQLVANDAGRIELGIQGSDKWIPKRIYLFGLDSPSPRPKHVVPLARLSDPGPLSADPTEGFPAIRLPLA